MARARNIKPGFFKNEDLAECSPWARLCFAGLWTLADREGRLEDRPKRIKAELFAFDSLEVESLLAELVRFKFIVRYVVGDVCVIQIVEFLKHQHPHQKEPESGLPSMESLGLLPDATEPKPGTQVSLHEPKAPDNTGAQVQKSEISSTPNRAESPIRSPDPPIRSPDTGALIAESGEREPGVSTPRPTRKCPAAFVVTQDLVDWANRETPGVDVDRETAKLRDHTFARAISDWPGAWRNWMRKALDDMQTRGAPRRAGGSAAAPATTSGVRAKLGLAPQGDFLDLERHHG